MSNTKIMHDILRMAILKIHLPLTICVVGEFNQVEQISK